MADEEISASQALLARRHEWPLIARDLALLAVPVEGATTFAPEDIARVHGLTQGEFDTLLQVSSFQTLVAQEVDRIQELGPHAGVRLRAEAMSMALQEYLFKRAQSGALEDKTVLQLLGVLMKAAGIEQPVEQVQAAAPQSTVNIAFNLPRLPTNRKLAHLMNQPQVNVIDGVLE